MIATEHLDELERRSLIALASASPDLAYIFRHVLAQDAVYASLVRRQRILIHQLVGEVLEALYPEQAARAELAALLGRHFSEAGAGEQALPYLVLAGDHALSRYANREAAEYYARALEIARAQPGAGRLRHLYQARGQALERCGDYALALAGYEEMEAQASEAGDESTALLALTAQTRLRSTFTSVSDPVRGRALAERALALAQQLGDGAAEARLLLYRMRQYVWTGDTDQVITYGERAAGSARSQGLQPLLLETLNELAHWGYVNSWQLRLAAERFDEARALLPVVNDLYQRLETLDGLAMLGELTGHFATSLQISTEIQSISQGLGFGWGLSQYHSRAGIIYLEQGELGLALQLLEDGVREAHQFSIGQAAAITCGFLYRAYCALGEYPAGLEAVRQVKDEAARIPSLAAWPLAVECLLNLAAGRLEQAAGAFDLAQQAGPARDIIAYRLLARAEAELGLALGDTERVTRVADRVIADMRLEGGRALLAEALAYRGRALLAAGRLDEARLSLEEARALAEVIGMRLVLLTVLAALLDLAGRQGQVAEAQTLRRELRDLVGQLADGAGSPERRAGFLGTAGVRAALALTK